MDNTTLQGLSLLIVLIVIFVVVFIQTIQSRGRKIALRQIQAYEALPFYVGEAIESSHPLHLSFGSAGIGGNSTILALAAAEFFYYVTEEAAIGDASPIITLTNPTAIPLGQDTLRRAYQARDRYTRFSPYHVRWYPAGERSLAYAAAISVLMDTDNVSAHVLAGSFGTEMALILDSASHRGQGSIAVSDQLTGQAIAYAMADHALIGEEVFSAPAYLGDKSTDLAESVTVDLLRYGLVFAIFVLMIVTYLDRLG